MMDRIGPYLSLPNIPSPSGVVQERPDHEVAMVQITEFTCGPPPITEFNPQPIHNGYGTDDQHHHPFLNEERNLMGSAYHKLELNFLFSGKS